jgi:hypothetical protein
MWEFYLLQSRLNTKEISLVIIAVVIQAVGFFIGQQGYVEYGYALVFLPFFLTLVWTIKTLGDKSDRGS